MAIDPFQAPTGQKTASGRCWWDWRSSALVEQQASGEHGIRNSPEACGEAAKDGGATGLATVGTESFGGFFVLVHRHIVADLVFFELFLAVSALPAHFFFIG